MCAVLACTTIMSNLIPVYATETIITESPMDESVSTESDWNAEESNFEEIEVTYEQSSSYFVTIPKTIALGTNKQAAYSVKVTGEIDVNQRVYVAPVDGISSTETIDFYMKDQTLDSQKADVLATVTQNKLYWNSDDVANSYEETNNSISAPDLTTGTWKGNFQVEIRLETNSSHTHNYVDGVCTECGEKDPNAEHEHNYIDGKCECGEIDPNHEHNYVDGTCTICGKGDSYDIAPADAYSDWNYTLDEANKIITLNYYQNYTNTDVIVYANYVIDGVTYKTKIKDLYYSVGNTAPVRHMFSQMGNIKTIKFSENIDMSNVKGLHGMFYNCTNLASIEGISDWDLTSVTDMDAMFCGCQSLTKLDLSNWKLANVTDAAYLFSNCKSLTEVNMNNWVTSSITHMNSMFSGCSSLINLDLSNWDTSGVIYMGSMFISCTSLTSLDLSNFDTGNVTNMSGMFRACTSLASLNLSSFNTSNVTDMRSMFEGCTSLTSLDLSSYDTRKATDMGYMFYNCSNLTTIYATNEKWSTSKASTGGMFSSCGTSSVTYK